MSCTVSEISLYPSRLLDNSRIRQLADWTTRGMDKSRTAHHIRKKSAKHPHFTRFNIRTSGDPHTFSLTFWAVSRPLAWSVGLIRQCISLQYTAGAASMAGAWFIHWPVKLREGVA